MICPSDLLTNLSWVEDKLHTYGVASVVQDYRRCGERKG